MERRSYFSSTVHGHYLNSKLSVEELSGIGLSSWPPKYYTCSFCKRQFSSAQALGGHMNVHRRDRARLISQLPSWVLECTTPNPNPNSSPPKPSPSPSPTPPSLISPFAKSIPCNKPLVDDEGRRRDPFYEELMKMKSRRPSVVGFGEFEGFAQPKCELDHQVLVKKKEIISLDLEMGFKDPEEILDLELRLGYSGTRDSSNLLAHEAAFALGQMQDTEAIPALESVLNDLSLHPIVRRENSLLVDPAPEVQETCELALKRIQELETVVDGDGTLKTEKSPFMWVDPAEPVSPSSSSVDELDVLLDEEKCMYDLYAALFALRNHGGEAAVSAIIDSLGGKRALLRHKMNKLLHFWRNLQRIQSCEVALSMLEYERSGKSFECSITFWCGPYRIHPNHQTPQNQPCVLDRINAIENETHDRPCVSL